MKPVRPIIISARRPYTSPSRPPATSVSPNARAYPDTTHWMVDVVVRSPACIDGIATLTMVTSSSAMKPTASVTPEDPPPDRAGLRGRLVGGHGAILPLGSARMLPAHAQHGQPGTMGPVVTRRQFLYASSGLALAAVAGCSAGRSGPERGREPVGDQRLPQRHQRLPDPDRRRPSPTATPTPTGSPKPEVAGTIADDFDVPWGLIFLAGGDALVSERNSAKIIRVTAKGKKTTLGEVSGVVPPDRHRRGRTARYRHRSR